MKLAISNIAFEKSDDLYIYEQMQKIGFEGLEIAPTRIIPQNPYDSLETARDFSHDLKQNYGLKIVSMQSIWFGITQNIFANPEDRLFLTEYTKKAIDFAGAVGCGNIVFGCPRNRVIGDMKNYPTAVEFFRELGEYAKENSTVVAIEANPPIYNTDFINNDNEALKLYKDVNSSGFKINLDIGTVIHNNQNLQELDFSAISHVHLSEPGLEKIKKRDLHKQLADIMRKVGYNGWVSIEMKKGLSPEQITQIMQYAKEVFF